MSIYAREGSPFLWCKFQVNSRTIRESTNSAKLSEAKAYEARRRAEVAAALAPGAKVEISLLEALKRYIEEVAAFQSTHVEMAAMALRIGRALAHHGNLSDPIDSTLARYVGRRRGEKARHKDTLCSNATVNREVQLLRRVYMRARDVWKAPVDMPNWGGHILPEADERNVALSAEAATRLFKYLRPDYHDLFRAALASGLRLSNLASMQWSQVDEGAGVVALKVKSKKQGGRVVNHPLRGEFLRIVQSVRGQHPRFVFSFLPKRRRRAGGALVIEFRQPFGAGTWRRNFLAARKKAGLGDLRFHDLRHVYGNAVYQATKDIRQTQVAMGHADVQSTLRYMHADTAKLADALDTLILPLPTIERKEQAARK